MPTRPVVTHLAHIEAALRPLADPQQAVPMRAYMLDQFAFLGIRATPRQRPTCPLSGRIRTRRIFIQGRRDASKLGARGGVVDSFAKK